MSRTLGEIWDAQAAAWARWVRTPGQDRANEELNVPRLVALLPAPGRATLDLGCGEGRFGRVLRALGHRVVAVDASPAMVARAAETQDAVVADAAALPFEDGAFDLVTAFMSLQDMDDLDGAVGEAGRVLERGGRLCFCVTHPLMTAGAFVERSADAPFAIEPTSTGAGSARSSSVTASASTSPRSTGRSRRTRTRSRARTPGHDGYWAYRDAFFDFLPPPAGRALEVGCGEGRVCRDLRERGYAVVGLDASPTLVAAAGELDRDGEYLVGAAESLPFADDAFDLVVAYNSLMDVDDMPAAVAEAARVLSPGGRLCVCVLHPIADAGRWTSRDDDATFLIEDSYAEERDYEVPAARDGLEFTFASRRDPLESYGCALEAAGLLIESLREPASASARWSRLPQFLHLRAAKA